MTDDPMPDEGMCFALHAEVERLRGALEQCRIALEHCRHRPHEHNPLPPFTITECEVIDRALAQLNEVLGPS